MTAKIVVPELSESVREARIARWLKHEGDPVTAGESLVELETEKVNVEVGAEWAGVLAKIERREGEDVRSGDVLGVIEDAPVHAPGAADAQAPPPQAAVGGPVKQPKTAAAETAASSEEQASVRGPARAPAPMVTRWPGGSPRSTGSTSHRWQGSDPALASRNRMWRSTWRSARHPRVRSGGFDRTGARSGCACPHAG